MTRFGISYCMLLLSWYSIPVASAPDILVHDATAISCHFDDATFCHYLSYGWGFTLSVKKAAQHIMDSVWSAATSSVHTPLPIESKNGLNGEDSDDQVQPRDDRIGMNEFQKGLTGVNGEVVNVSQLDYFPCTTDKVNRASLQLRLQANVSTTAKGGRLCLHMSYAIRGEGKIQVKFGNRTWRLLGDLSTGNWYRAQVPLWQIVQHTTTEMEEDRLLSFLRLRILARPDACVDNITFTYDFPPTPTSSQHLDSTKDSILLLTSSSSSNSQANHDEVSLNITNKVRNFVHQLIQQSTLSPPSNSLQPIYGCQLRFWRLVQPGETSLTGADLFITQGFFYGLTALRTVLQPYLWLLPLSLVMFAVLLIIILLSMACSRSKRLPVSTLNHSTGKSGNRSLQRQGSIQLPTIVQSRIALPAGHRVQATRSLIITDDYSVNWDAPSGPATLPTRFSSPVEEEPALEEETEGEALETRQSLLQDVWQRSSQIVESDTDLEDLGPLEEDGVSHIPGPSSSSGVSQQPSSSHLRANDNIGFSHAGSLV